MSELVSVMICVNHGENGLPAERIRALHISDEIELESNYYDEDDSAEVYPSCVVENDHIQIGDMRPIPIHGQHHWVGNWCWDSVTVTPDAAKKIVNYLTMTLGWNVVMHTDGGRYVPSREAKSDLTQWSGE